MGTGDLAATCLEPVAQRGRRETVLAVVRGHPVAKGDVDAVRIHLERQLDVQARQRGVAEVVLAAEADERLELRQPVPFDAMQSPSRTTACRSTRRPQVVPNEPVDAEELLRWLGRAD